MLPMSLPMFQWQLLIPGQRAVNVLCNCYDCVLATAGEKLENVKVP